MSKKFYQFGANDEVTQPADLAAKQEKIYTTSSTATFTAPSTVTVTSGSTSKTLSAQYSGLTLVDGDWICNVYFEGDGVAEDVEFSTSDGGHTESETSVNFGTQSFNIVIDQTTFTGAVNISATRTSTTTYCGAEADKTPTEDSNKLVTSGGVYDAVEAAISADVTHAKSISATGVSTPCEPDEDGDVDVSSLFSGDNTLLMETAYGKNTSSAANLAPGAVGVVDGSSGTAASPLTVAVSFAAASGTALRYCELLITGIVADSAVTLSLPAGTYQYGAGATYTSSGNNHFIFAEYASGCWFVSKEVTTAATVTA